LLGHAQTHRKPILNDYHKPIKFNKSRFSNETVASQFQPQRPWLSSKYKKQQTRYYLFGLPNMAYIIANLLPLIAILVLKIKKDTKHKNR
jgi:hypothetical protein